MKRSFTIFLLLACCGCANLKQVNDFAAGSLKGVQCFETLPDNFQKLCNDACMEKDIVNGRLDTSACNCAISKKADQKDGLLYKALTTYLDGLQKLSANELTTYTTDSLADKLIGLKLMDTVQAGAYSAIANILFKAVADGYRRNKIKIYIREANAPLKIIVGDFRISIDDLLLELRNKQIKLKGDYFDLLKKETGSSYEQREVITGYYALAAQIETEKSVLIAYKSLLQKVADGHQQLYDNLEKLDKAEIKGAIGQYASSIKDIHTQIQLLK